MEGPRAEHLTRWWQFWNVRQGMRAALATIPRYMACSRVTKRPIFCFVHPSIVPDTALQVFALHDDYSFGILQSDLHWQWFMARCSKLKADFRYTVTSVFNSFPFPQAPSQADVEAVAAASREVRSARTRALRGRTGGLRGLYKLLELPGKNELRDAHIALDAAVRNAYGFGKTDGAIQSLLALNREVNREEATGRRSTGPGIPTKHARVSGLSSTDCVRSE